MPKYPQSDLVRQLFQKGQPLTYGKGQVILGNDPRPNGVYYIHSGYIKVYSISNQGEQKIHIIYGSGEIFPMTWAYLGVQANPVFYETISDTVVWRMSRDWFHHFIDTRHDVSQAMSQQLAQQFRIYAERIDNLEYKKASDRVIYRLIFLASRFGIKEKDGILIDPVLTHEIIAATINLARESVSRELERLESKKLIKVRRHHILITDLQGLAAQIGKESDLRDWYLE